MKTLIPALILLCSLAACKKETIPASLPNTPAVIASTTTTPPSTTTTSQPGPTQSTPVAANTDTIPEMAALRLKLVKDNTNYDETLFFFKHESTPAYDAMQDGKYLAGFGQVSLASISSDGKDLVVNSLNYTPGMSIGLDVNAKTDGTYSFQVSLQKNLPADIHVWLKDNLLKDSVNVRTANYNFDISKADPNSFGSKRFELIIKR